MILLNEEIKEQERQAIKELYPELPTVTTIVSKAPLKPLYKAHRIQFVAMSYVTKILAKYGYLEVSGGRVAMRYRRTKESISLPDLVKMVDELHMTKFSSMAIVSRIPKKEKKTNIEPEQVQVNIKKSTSNDNGLPVIGSLYYFITDNHLIGCGVLKTIEGILDEDNRVKSFRYEVIMKGVSYIVTELYNDLNSAANIVW